MYEIPPKLTIKSLTMSGRILASALNLSKRLTIPGAVPLHIDQKIERFITSLNAKPSFKGFNGYPNSICVSLNSQIVHGMPTNSPLKKGDLITIDIGVSYKNNHTDAARTFVVGKDPSDKILNIINATQKALDDGIYKAIKGNTIGDISYAIQRIVEFNNYKTPLELGGHGIGLVPHDEPFIPNYGVSGSGYILVPGMCLAIEPIVIDGPKEIKTGDDGWTVFSPSKSLSAHIEDTIIITNDVPIILTRNTLENKTI